MKIIKTRGNDDPFSFLGETIMFTGKIQSKGTISIDGHVKGDMSSIENLIVGKEAVIESDLDVRSLVLHGEVRGNISACDTVKILSTGRVYGDILSPSVMMESGAVVDGMCIVKPEAAATREVMTPHGGSVSHERVGEGL